MTAAAPPLSPPAGRPDAAPTPAKSAATRPARAYAGGMTPGDAPDPPATPATPPADASDATFHTEHAAAAAAWPAVPWPAAAYAAHRGHDTPAHPADLYLAGAAGHRVDPAWAALEERYAGPVQSILNGLERADYNADDLWGETRLHLFDDDPAVPAKEHQVPLPDLPDGRRPARLVRYRGDASLQNYLVLAARNRARTRQRSRDRRGVHLSLDAAPGPDERSAAAHLADPAAPAPPEQTAAAEDANRLTAALAVALDALTVEQRALVRLVYGQQMPQKDAGVLIGRLAGEPDGWSPFKTSRTMTAARARLREAFEAKLGPDAFPPDDPQRRDAWANAWNAVWNADATQAGHAESAADAD